jgi:hypothetical protein
MNRHPLAETLAGTACVCAYLTGTLVGHLARHPAPIAVLALAVTAIRHRPRRKTASGRTTA